MNRYKAECLVPVSEELQQAIVDELKRATPETQKTKQILVRVEPKMKQKLMQIAEYRAAVTGEKIHISELIREYIIDGIESDMLMIVPPKFK